MNAPKIEERVFLLPDEVKVTQEEDTKIEGAANFVLIKEDHTIMVIKIQTKNTSTPQLALLDAINALKNEFKHLDTQFKEAVNTYKDQASQGAMEY